MTIREKKDWAGPLLRIFLCGFLALILFAEPSSGAQAGKQLSSVPICHGVTFSASYLSEAKPGKGPGFLLSLTNNTGRVIRLAEPMPSSADWYALTQGRWLWRASNGTGGSLLDATRERGRLVLYNQPVEEAPDKYFTVQPHQTRNWIESERENPVLEYKPGCPLCSYPGEHDYRVVFAYAYLPQSQARPGLLPCGLRTKPVPMPPKP